METRRNEQEAASNELEAVSRKLRGEQGSGDVVSSIAARACRESVSVQYGKVESVGESRRGRRVDGSVLQCHLYS
jgi:hypothetical protein